jgi:hypothetical protein
MVCPRLGKPKLFAKVEVTPKFLSVTNGNGTAWTRTTIILNDAFAVPILEVSDGWAPNETKYYALSDFRGRFNRQAFNPDYEQVREVTIQVKGFQLGIYQTRTLR